MVYTTWAQGFKEANASAPGDPSQPEADLPKVIHHSVFKTRNNPPSHTPKPQSTHLPLLHRISNPMVKSPRIRSRTELYGHPATRLGHTSDETGSDQEMEDVSGTGGFGKEEGDSDGWTSGETCG